jgi:hypothetical protein
MLRIIERCPAIRTLHGWAISVPKEAGAIRERAFDVARQDPPTGVSAEAAAVAIAEVLDSIGDTCPECPAE